MSSVIVAALIQKLSHPLEEVRQRSLHSLLSKVETRLVDLASLTSDAALPAKLLTLAASADSLPTVRLEALRLIARVAHDPAVSRQLAKLGAIGQLQRLQQAALEGGDAGTDPNALAAAAVRAADAILHHPAGELAISELMATEKTPPSAPPPTATSRAAPLPSAPSAPGASRSLDRAFHRALSNAPAAAASGAGVVSYGGATREADAPWAAPPRRPTGAKLALPCPRWLELRCAPLRRVDDQTLFESSVRLPSCPADDPCMAVA